MKIYRANRRIEHGESDGSVVVYNPGADVPAKLGRALPKLVDVIDVEGVERVKPARATDKQPEQKPEPKPEDKQPEQKPGEQTQTGSGD